MGARAMKKRPRPVPRRKLGPPPPFLKLAIRWAVAWAVIGVVLGVMFMLGKAPPFGQAATAPRSDNILAYAFWIPMLGGAAAAAGLGVGIIFAVLMIVTTDWRDSLEGDGLMIRLGPDMLCGAAAGMIAGLLVGGITGALFFATLGAFSAAGMNWVANR